MREKNIKIDVQCESLITNDLYSIVLESLLKYILYQCQQIPVQIDVLEGEIKNLSDVNRNHEFNEITSHKNLEESTNPRTHLISLRNQILIRREEVAKRNFERKRKRWLLKVQKLIESYRSTLDILKQGIGSNGIKSAVFALGPSPLTAKYVFQIHAPPKADIPDTSTNKIQCNDMKPVSVKRKILLSLFRAFAGSNDLTTLTNIPFSVTKVWTLIEKETDPYSELKRMDNFPEHEFISRPEFRFAPRARVIEVFLNGKAPGPVCSNEMILTPCVGALYPADSIKRRKDVKTALFQESNKKLNACSPLNSSESGDQAGVTPLDGSSTGIFLMPMAQTPRVGSYASCNSTSKAAWPNTPQTSFTPRQSFITSADMVETPVASNAKALLSATPSPVKRLAVSIAECHFASEETETPFLWYQINTSINGFKDVYLS